MSQNTHYTKKVNTTILDQNVRLKSFQTGEVKAVRWHRTASLPVRSLLLKLVQVPVYTQTGLQTAHLYCRSHGGQLLPDQSSEHITNTSARTEDGGSGRTNGRPPTDTSDLPASACRFIYSLGKKTKAHFLLLVVTISNLSRVTAIKILGVEWVANRTNQ